MDQLSFEGNLLQAELSERGYALIDHGILPEQIDAVIDSYAKFTDNHPDPSLETMAAMNTDPEHLDVYAYENDRQSEWHKYRTNFPFPFKPGGYTNRSLQKQALREVKGIEIKEDPKEYYHFLPAGQTYMGERHNEFGWGAIPPEVHTLHMRFMAIHKLGVKTVTEVMQKLEESHPGLTKQFITRQDLIDSPLRLLFYHPGQGDLLAGRHYDKSMLTAQLAESHEGLRLHRPGTEIMQPIKRPPEKAVVFAGSLFTLEHVHPDSWVKPGWHDVINSDSLNEGRHLQGTNVARWALIFFANSHAAGEIGKDLTHTEQPTTKELVA